MSSPAGSGCSSDYFDDDIFALDPHEDLVGHQTQSGPLVQDADPLGFTNQEGLPEMISGSMPQIVTDNPILGDGPLPLAAGMDPHLDSIDPALLLLPATTNSGCDPSLATSNEAFQGSASASGSQDVYPAL